MTRLSLPLALVIFASLLTAHAEEVPFIEVHGTATQKAPVDKVSWTLRIRSVDPELATAARLIDESYQTLRRDVEALQIPTLEIRAAEIASGREYERGDNQRKFLGFFAERGLSLSVADVARVSEIQARLLQDDRISIIGVYRGSTNELELKTQAWQGAARAAREKADQLAQVLHFKLGRALGVAEGNVSLSGGASVPYLTSNVINQPVFAARDGAELDQVSVTQTVTVKFAIAE